MFCCPECKKQLSCYDHGEERQWRHLDSCQFKTILIGRVPRVECPEHGVKSVAVPWAEPHSRFTIMFERFAIEVLLMTQTVKGAMTILRLLWDATWNIIERLSNVVRPERNRRYYREWHRRESILQRTKVCLDLVQHRQQHCRSNSRRA